MTRFFSFDARIARLRLLVGVVAGLALAWLGVLVLRQGAGLGVPVVGAVGGLTVAKLLVEAARRRHDGGGSARGALALLMLGVVVIAAALLHALASGDFLLHYAAIAAFVVSWAALLLRGGAPANRYGAPPVPLLPSFAERPRRAGMWLALVLALAGGALGLLANDWLGGLAAQRVQDQQAAQRPDAPAPDNLEAEYQEQAR